jgi:hypothetical protein
MNFIPTTISGITKRRAEIQSELEDCQARAAACRLAIWHVNVTLEFCDENGGSREVSRRYTVHERKLRHGAISNLIMSALRAAEKPLTAREILNCVRRMLGPKSRAIDARRLDNAIRSALICKIRQGLVTCHKSSAASQTFDLLRNARAGQPEHVITTATSAVVGVTTPAGQHLTSS